MDIPKKRVGGFRPGNYPDKKCAVCDNIFKPIHKRHKFCQETCKGKWKYINLHVTTEGQYRQISGNWRRYLARLCCRSMARGTLTVDQLLLKLEQQNYKCALSGVQLTCTLQKGIKNKTNASLDRIIPGGLYSIDNINLVCSSLNSWRSDTKLSEFIWWCKQVTEYNNDQNP